MKNEISNICSVAELSNLLQQSVNGKNSNTDNTELRVLDCSWYMPSQQINTAEAYRQMHIPSAAFFHIDEVCDHDSEYPHMLPSAEQFSKAARALGVTSNSNIVVYDSAGLFSAARVWWMFRVFGHSHVRVLNGGLPAWVKMGGSVESSDTCCIAIDEHYQAEEGEVSEKAAMQQISSASPMEHVASIGLMRENCESGRFKVLDARSLARFNGEAPEPRPGLPSGHMPNSLSLPFDDLIHEGHLKPVDKLQEIFASRGIDANSLSQNTQIITTCGSGVTAAIITLALDECGFGLQRLYDGSWSEWASQNDALILSN